MEQMSEQSRFKDGNLPRELESSPPQFQNRWVDVHEELRAAAADLDRASKRYHAAIVARLAINQVRQDLDQDRC